MFMKILVVVDMQNDFIDGALGTKEAVAILPAVKAKIEAAKAEGTAVVFTKDTHSEDYLNTQEGRNLPVKHCIKGSEGWEIAPSLASLAEGCVCFEKPTFGSEALAAYVKESGADEVELIGICTDICVISNAMLIKAALPEVPVSVDSACCAGVTPQSHENALNAMKMCQIAVK